MLWTILCTFKSVFGNVEMDTLMSGLKIMLYGMVGIFVAMALIFLVIVILNRVAKDKKEDKE